MDEFNHKLANLAINYSLNVQQSEKILITGSEIAHPLILALYKEILKVGGYPFVLPQLSGLDSILFKYGNKSQIKFMAPAENDLMRTFDGRIYILADVNAHKFQKVSLEKLQWYNSSKERGITRSIRETRVAQGKFKWVAIPFPCHAFAQKAGMDLFAYQEFVASALKFNKKDPVKEWINFGEDQERIAAYLNKVETIKILGEDTDLTIGVKGRRWANACGHNNLPDGEIFTGPVENALDGHIRFTFPGVYQNREIENIYLEFERGEVTKATASKGEDLLHSLLEIDGAKHIGEFAFGTNYGITNFSKSMLFDEKIGGTIHLALGNGYIHTGSKNKSAIHWDILKDMRSEDSKVFADGTLIYQAGKWQI